MVTKDLEVGPKGDCIIGVGSDKSVSDLLPGLKRLIRSGKELVITLRAEGMIEKVRARGHPSLALDHPTDIVVRKSKFICGRTLAVNADKAAADLSRNFVAALRKPGAKLEIKIEVNVARQGAY